MVDLTNIKDFTVDKVKSWSLFGTDEEFNALPVTHQDQIFFLDKNASKYIYEFSARANLTTGDVWDPFAKGNFKKVEEFNEFYRNEESQAKLKKWLYNRGIAFKTWVFLLPNFNDYPILTTWKMVVKYSDVLFSSDDIMVFDQTINWCLFFFHENHLYFGTDKIDNLTEGDLMMQILNEKKKKYPNFKHPYL